MRKTILSFIITFLLAVLIIVLDLSYFDVFVKRIKTTGTKVIIVDAGHGGMDGGAIGRNGTVEKEINLEIAKKLKAYIEQHGDVCIMIREIDEGLYSQDNKTHRKAEDFKNRKEIIKESNADMLISIHLNSYPEAKYYGAQVFFQREDKISETFARITQEELVKVLNRNNKRVEKSSETYYIIKDNGIPSILVECGFLSNPEEEMLLRDSSYQNKIAWAIYKGMIRFLEGPKAAE